jgi:WD40 repeat protein/uncharacterized caspase-like protein
MPTSHDCLVVCGRIDRVAKRFIMPATRLISLGLMLLWFSTSVAQQLGNPELDLQKGHSGLVMSFALSPDGRLIATGGGDNTIKLWNVESGKVIRTFEGRTAAFSVAFSPGGRILAAANDDGTIKFWDIDNGIIIRNLELHPSVRCIAFSPDGEVLASAGGQLSDKNGGAIRFWDAETGTLLNKIGALTDVVRSVAFSPDGKLLAAEGSESSINLWNVQTGKLARTLKKSDSPYETLAFAFSPDSRLLAIAGAEINAEKNISLWDVQKGALVRNIKGQKKPKSTSDPAYPVYQAFEIVSVAFSPDGQRLAAGISDNTIRLWEPKSGKLIRTIQGRAGKAAQPLVFSTDSKMLAAIASDGSVGTGRTVSVWNADTGELLRSLEDQSGAALSLTFSPEGIKLGSGSVEDTVNLWDMKAGRLVRSLNGRSPTLVPSVAMSPDGKMLAARSTSAFGPGNIKLWDVETGSLIRTLSDIAKKYGEAVVFSPRGDLIASVDGNSVKIWEVYSGRLIHNIDTKKEGELYSLEFSPDGKTIAAVGEYKNIIFCDVESGRIVRGFNAQDANPIYRATFSPDGKIIATGPIDLFRSYKTHAVRLWDVETGALLKKLDGHAGSVGGLRFNSDGRLLVSGDTAGAIRLWDVYSGQLLRTFDGHYGSANAVVFSTDGKTIVSALEDGTIKVWSIETGQLLVSLLAFEDGTWAAVAPDGLFDGSPSALKKISWRFSPKLSDVAPVEIFFNEYYYPGLLAEVMSGQRPKARQEMSQKDRRQPQLSLVLAESQIGTSARTINVRIEASEMPPDKDHATGSGVRDVRLFRNGSLVHVWRGSVLPGKDKKAILTATLPIVAGENELTAYCFNNDNIKSADGRLMVKGAESLKRQGTAYVLAVGLNNYSNSQYDLRYAVADAKAFGEHFGQQQMNLGRFGKVEIVSLFDKDATKANILLALKRLTGSDSAALTEGAPALLRNLQPAQPEDAVIVYFAGHGTSQQNKFFLVPHDLGYHGSPWQLNRVALDTILAHSISDRDLEQAFEQIDSEQILLIIDACNSGQALEAEEKRRGPMNSKGLAQLAYEKGMYILTAAQSYQAALETPQHGHGYLTYALVEEGLKSTNADTDPRDGQVMIREWLDYATRRVPQLQEENAVWAKKNPPPKPPPVAQQKSQRSTRPQRGRQGSKTTADQEEKARQLEKERQQAVNPVPLEEKNKQQPRVFYRREGEVRPLVVARPN